MCPRWGRTAAQAELPEQTRAHSGRRKKGVGGGGYRDPGVGGLRRQKHKELTPTQPSSDEQGGGTGRHTGARKLQWASHRWSRPARGIRGNLPRHWTNSYPNPEETNQSTAQIPDQIRAAPVGGSKPDTDVSLSPDNNLYTYPSIRVRPRSAKHAQIRPGGASHIHIPAVGRVRVEKIGPRSGPGAKNNLQF